MTDELDLLRGADPVPAADDGPFRDRPLTPGAEHRLSRLTGHDRARGLRSFLRPRITAPAVALVAAIAVLAGVLFNGASPAPAVAAPRPLVPYASTETVPLTEVARGAALLAAHRTAAGAATATRRGSHYQAWSLAMESGPGAAPPVTLPTERMVRWSAAGSRTDLTVATDPAHPGRPVIADRKGSPTAVSDGTVLEKSTDAPGALGTSEFVTPPPRDVSGLSRYLAERNRGQVAGATPSSDPATRQVLDGLSAFLHEWTPGTRENAVLASVLARCGGLRPAGAITDRLGRHGQGYTYEPDGGSSGIRYLLILDPRTGTVLGIEQTFTRPVPDAAVVAGDVMSYEAFMF
jgi:hypothetical protein